MMRENRRLLRGYLEVLAEGKNAGRFLNLCARNGIRLWDVRSAGEGSYVFRLCLRDFYRVRPFCRKTHTRVRIRRRKGLPFLLHRYRKRLLFVISFGAAALLLRYYSGFVWKIQISGNSYLSQEVLIRYLDERKLGFGSQKAGIDCEALELSLRQDFPEVIWASSYIEGTKLVVEIQENLKTEGGKGKQDLAGNGNGAGASGDGTDPAWDEKTGPEICTDLVAAKDAVIASIVTRSGVPFVKEQDEVKAGDLLVCGRQEILDDAGNVKEYFYRSGDADVYGIVTYEYGETIPITQNFRRDTGRKKHSYFLEIFSRRFETIDLYNDYDCYRTLEEYHQFRLTDSFYLPVFYGEKETAEQTSERITRTKEEIKKIAGANLALFLKKLEENGVYILDKNVMIEKVGESYVVSGTITAIEPIAVKAPTEILTIQKEGTVADEFE